MAAFFNDSDFSDEEDFEDEEQVTNDPVLLAKSEYDEFMRSHTRKNGMVITHTSMGVPYNAFSIGADDVSTFHQLYAKYIATGGKPCVVERPLVTSTSAMANTYLKPFLIDLDLRYHLHLGNDRKHYYHQASSTPIMTVDDCDPRKSLAYVIGFIKEVYEIIRTNFTLTRLNGVKYAEHTFFIMERPDAHDNRMDVNGTPVYKDGVHIVSPDLMMTIGEQLAIRNVVCDKVDSLPFLSKLLQYTINPIGDIYDQSVINFGSWTMYHSTKTGKEPYLNKAVVVFKDHVGHSEYTTEVYAYDKWVALHPNLREMSPVSFIDFEVSRMSIRKSNIELDYKLTPNENFVASIPKYVPPVALPLVDNTSFFNTSNGEAELERLKTCLKYVNINRAMQYADWVKTNSILVDMAIDSPSRYTDLYELWHAFSARAPNYCHQSCDRLWNGTYTKRLAQPAYAGVKTTPATLFYWLRTDAPSMFEHNRQQSDAAEAPAPNTVIPLRVIEEAVATYVNSTGLLPERVQEDMLIMCDLFSAMSLKTWSTNDHIDMIQRNVYLHFGDPFRPIWRACLEHHSICKNYSLEKWHRNDCSQHNASSENVVYQYKLLPFINDTREFYARENAPRIASIVDMLLEKEMINPHPIDYLPTSALFCTPTVAAQKIHFFKAFVATRCSGLIVPVASCRPHEYYICGDGIHSNMSGKHQYWRMLPEMSVLGRVADAYESFLFNGLAQCILSAQLAFNTSGFAHLTEHKRVVDQLDELSVEKKLEVLPVGAGAAVRKEYASSWENYNLEQRGALKHRVDELYKKTLKKPTRAISAVSATPRNSVGGEVSTVPTLDKMVRPFIPDTSKEYVALRERYTGDRIAMFKPPDGASQKTALSHVASIRAYIGAVEACRLGDKFNKNSKLFGFTNLLIDSTNPARPTIRGAEMSDYVSKVVSYGLKYPGHVKHDAKVQFDEFFKKVLPDDETFNFLMLTIGAIITGTPVDQAIYVWYGPTAANGKSTTIKLIQEALSGVQVTLEPGVLFKNDANVKDASGASPEIAKMDGMRFATVPEVTSDMRFNASQMKILASPGEKMTGRALFQDSKEILTQAQVHIVCNSLPTMAIGADEGVIRRIVIFMFESRFVDTLPEGTKEGEGGLYLKGDPLTNEILEEMKHVVIWMGLAYWRDYQITRKGVRPEKPLKTKGIVDSYIKQSNSLAAFLIDQLAVKISYKAFYKNAGNKSTAAFTEACPTASLEGVDPLKHVELVRGCRRFFGTQSFTTEQNALVNKTIMECLGEGRLNPQNSGFEFPGLLFNKESDSEWGYLSEVIVRQPKCFVESPPGTSRLYAVDCCTTLEKCGVYIDHTMVETLNFVPEKAASVSLEAASKSPTK